MVPMILLFVFKKNNEEQIRFEGEVMVEILGIW